MLRAAMVHDPILGAKPLQVNAQPALRLKSVQRVVTLDDAVAVVAGTCWQALKGAQALEVTWDKTESPGMDTELLRKRCAGLAQESGATIYQKGEPQTAPRGRKIVSDCYLPYQAHANPEPMNCTAWVGKDFCRVWAPTQNQDAAQEMAARITGLP